MTESTYAAADNPYDAERARLDMLERMNDPLTQRRMNEIGIEKGWRCLEIGAGGGSVVRWLSDQVGDTGSVVACDLNPRFLQDLGLRNVEVREHNILTDDLEENAFDFAHCRAVLMHLPDPGVAIRKIAASLKPGGQLLFEEGDFGMFGATDPEYPGAEEFTRISRMCWDLSVQAGTMNSYFGRKLYGYLRSMKFDDIHNEGILRVGSGGDDPIGKFWRASFEVPGMQRLVDSGALRQSELDHLKRMMEDPNFHFIGGALFAARGTKPNR